MRESSHETTTGNETTQNEATTQTQRPTCPTICLIVKRGVSEVMRGLMVVDDVLSVWRLRWRAEMS